MITLEELRALYETQCKRVHETADAIDALGDDASEEDVQAAVDAHEAAVEEAERTKANLEQREAVERARKAHPKPEQPARAAVARGELREESTYRPDNGTSWFRDLYLQQKREAGWEDAARRLERHREEMAAHKRDMGSTSTAGAEFYPPLYLAELAQNIATAGRPFANAVPKMPLPPTGVSISVPSLDSGVSVEPRADNASVSETDGVTSTITSRIEEIAGQLDVGRIVLMRSDPGLDQFLYTALVKRYNATLDSQLINGTGTPPQLSGIRDQASANTVTYTDATPTAAELLPKLYDAAQKVASNRLDGVLADTVVMHPRRAAWLASQLSSTFPLLQQGGLNQAVGTQDSGFAGMIAGMRVIMDANVGTGYGSGTNEDEIYVLAVNDLVLMEGPLMSGRFDDVGSGTGTVRLQVFAHVGFLANLRQKAICIISGTGLATPSF